MSDVEKKLARVIAEQIEQCHGTDFDGECWFNERLLAKAILAAFPSLASPVDRDVREALARVIDPNAWGFDMFNLWKHRRDASTIYADRIISAFPSLASPVDREGAGWCPIETAPKDRWIWLWVSAIARNWEPVDEDQAPYMGHVARWDGEEGCWIDADYSRVKHATYWREVDGGPMPVNPEKADG
jgi:hypothetical protein